MDAGYPIRRGPLISVALLRIRVMARCPFFGMSLASFLGEHAASGLGQFHAPAGAPEQAHAEIAASRLRTVPLSAGWDTCKRAAARPK